MYTLRKRFQSLIFLKNGITVTRIKNDTGCAIKIPSDSENSNVIRIEGEPKGVAQAKQELLEMAKRMVRTHFYDSFIMLPENFVKSYQDQHNFFFRKMKKPETSSLNKDSIEPSLEPKEKKYGKLRTNLTRCKWPSQTQGRRATLSH